MTFLYDNAAETCIHVACDGGACQYVPPAIGPALPQQVQASDGTLWTRHEGKCFYNQTAEHGYRIVTWSELADHGKRRRHNFEKFPEGPWTVTVPNR